MDHEPIGPEGLPTLIWRGAGAGPRPVIVSLHGGGGHKGDIPLDVVERVTARGVTVVTIDAYLHGERAAPNDDGRATPGPITRLQLLDIIGRTADDMREVVALLREDEAIDGERIGLRGGSMGGYIALAAVGLGVPVRAVLSICGGADYVEAWQWAYRDQAEKLQEIMAAMDWIADMARRFDPIHHVARFPPRPILFIHGERDPVVPVHCTRRLYDALVPRYADQPGDCLFLSHAGDHGTPQSMEEFGWDWLIGQLIGGPRRPHMARPQSRGGL